MTTAAASPSSQAQDGPFKILIDGLCPVCKLEGDMLRRMDKGRDRLQIVDITAPEFSAADYGTDWDSVMGKIHGVHADGSLVTGMEVFRIAYRKVGWGWLWAPTAWPLLRPIFDAFYRWFAKNRLRLTGRKDADCAEGRCRV
ncbi:MAG: DUF393 domain-containing protein [Planctomycetota bacterium]